MSTEPPQLADPDLLRPFCLIGGRWIARGDSGHIDVTNPATGGRIGTVPALSAAQAGEAVAAADRALPDWRARTAADRGRILHRWFELMLEHREDLARLMTAEQGKPLAESRGEIGYAASFLEWYAEEGKRVYGDIVPGTTPGQRILVLRQPVGVVATITPWNFPAAMLTRKVGPALAAGCTVVSRPASQTPYSALALAALGERAGLPAGVFNVITGTAGELGPALTGNPRVRKLSFTGSTPTGRKLIAACADTVKNLSMELGGNAPFLVFDDADLDAAVAGAVASKFRNTGQTCVCANRILVHDAVYDTFAQKLTDAVARLRVGDGLADGIDQGPLIDEAALAKVEEHVADARARGARVLIGGARHALGGTFYQPTVIVDATAQMRMAHEETFGPVAPLYRVADEATAIALANDTEYGLAAYCYTRDLNRALRVSEALEYGIVGLNTGLISTAVAPFGGVKQSGLGREGGRWGIDEYLDVKYVAIDGSGGR